MSTHFEKKSYDFGVTVKAGKRKLELVCLVAGRVPAFRRIRQGVARYGFENQELQIYYPSEVPLAELGGAAVRGWIVAVTHTAQVKQLQDAQTAVVNVSNRMETVGIPRWATDDVWVGRWAAEHLFTKGFRFVSWVGWMGMRFAEQRRQGFMERAGDRLIEGHELPQGHSAELAERLKAARRQAAELKAWLRTLPKPCGVFCFSDQVAIEVAGACRRSGISVPEEVAVLGVDNEGAHDVELARDLSSIDLPFEDIGYGAARELHQAILEGRAVRDRTFRPLGVVERKSTDRWAIEDDLVRKALRLMAADTEFELNVEELARQCGVNRKTLGDRFRMVLGRTPKEELTRRQMERAEQLLVGSQLTVAEIAYRCGFSKESNFCSAFKKKRGQTPGEFREGLGRR